MSVKALSAVFEESRAVDSAFVVALALADWCDHAGRCHPSYRQIAEKARVSRSTAIAAIQELVDLGEWGREVFGTAPSADRDDGPTNIRAQFRNAYRCLLMRPKVVQPSDHVSEKVVQPAAEGGPINTAEVVQRSRAHIRNRPSVRPSDRPSESTRASGHRRHVFCPSDRADGFCVPEFLHNELETMLGRRAPDIDLLGWYVQTDDRRRQERPTVLDGIGWWRDQMRAEIRRRGWASPTGAACAASQAPSYELWHCPHTPRCPHRAACRVVSQRAG